MSLANLNKKKKDSDIFLGLVSESGSRGIRICHINLYSAWTPRGLYGFTQLSNMLIFCYHLTPKLRVQILLTHLDLLHGRFSSFYRVSVTVILFRTWINPIMFLKKPRMSWETSCVGLYAQWQSVWHSNQPVWELHSYEKLEENSLAAFAKVDWGHNILHKRLLFLVHSFTDDEYGDSDIVVYICYKTCSITNMNFKSILTPLPEYLSHLYRSVWVNEPEIKWTSLWDLILCCNI